MGALRTSSALLVVMVMVMGVLGCAGVARGAVIGVNEDEGKLNPGLYGQLADVGLKQNVLSVTWTQGQGLASAVQGVMGNAIAAAQSRGIAVTLALYPAPGNASKLGDPANKAEFVAFVANVVRSFPAVRTVVVGNEPNRTLFMSPVNPALFAEILGDAYDAIKAVNPAIKVLGAGLSPRGTGDGKSLFPPQFVKGMGDWYRSSQRAKDGKPLMDAFSFHPYPFPEDKSVVTVSDWPVVGMADLYRLKQAIWDAFNGTAQKTVEDGLTLDLDEVAYQVPTDGKPGYAGSETVKTVDAATQAAYYAQLVGLVACDPQISSLSFFHFVDEADRGRFQSGLVDLTGARRPAYDALKQALVDTAGGTRCTGTPVAWTHATGVLGARPDLSKLKTAYPKTVSSFTVALRVEEDTAVQVAVFKLSGAVVTDADKAAIERTLALRGATAADPVQVATLSRAIPAAPMAKPDYAATLELKLPKALGDGIYVVVLVAKSALNPARLTRATSAAFTVGTVAFAPPATGGGGAKAPAVETELVLESAFPTASRLVPGQLNAITLKVSRVAAFEAYFIRIGCSPVGAFEEILVATKGQLRPGGAGKLALVLRSSALPGLYRIGIVVTALTGEQKLLTSVAYLVGAPADRAAPVVEAVAGSEVLPEKGDTVQLGYEACDDSGRSAIEITVKQGATVVQRVTLPPAEALPFRRSTMSWLVGRSGSKSVLATFCAVAVDPAGRRSPQSCAQITVTRTVRLMVEDLTLTAPASSPSPLAPLWPKVAAVGAGSSWQVPVPRSWGGSRAVVELYQWRCDGRTLVGKLPVAVPRASGAGLPSIRIGPALVAGGAAGRLEGGVYSFELVFNLSARYESPSFRVVGTVRAVAPAPTLVPWPARQNLPRTGGVVRIGFIGCSESTPVTIALTFYEMPGLRQGAVVDSAGTVSFDLIRGHDYAVYWEPPDFPAGAKYFGVTLKATDARGTSGPTAGAQLIFVNRS